MTASPAAGSLPCGVSVIQANAGRVRVTCSRASSTAEIDRPLTTPRPERGVVAARIQVRDVSRAYRATQ